MFKSRFASVCVTLAISAIVLSGPPSEARAAAPVLPAGFVAAPLFIGSTSTWEVRSLRGSALIPGTRITARFDGRRVTGSAGCNHYGGSYRAEGGSFRMTSSIFTTKMACLQPGVMRQEDSYVAALGEARSYVLRGRRLILRNAEGKVLVRLVASGILE